LVCKHKLDGSRSIGSLSSSLSSAKKKLLLSNYHCSYPVRRGVIRSMEDYESILDSVFYSKLKHNEASKVLMVQPMKLPSSTPSDGQNFGDSAKIREVLFEKVGLSALYLADDALCALYASGGNTGLCVSSGHGSTSIVPIYEGYVVREAAQRIELGGYDVSAALKQKLCVTGLFRSALSENKFAEQLKLKLSYVPLDYAKETQQTMFERIVYRLPDGSEIEVGRERFECAEPLMSVVGAKVQAALANSQEAIRRVLFENVVCSGGNSMMKGFDERLSKEIEAGRGAQAMAQGWSTRVFGLVDRTLSSWIGGSIMASLSHMEQLWMDKEQWLEHGTQHKGQGHRGYE